MRLDFLSYAAANLFVSHPRLATLKRLGTATGFTAFLILILTVLHPTLAQADPVAVRFPEGLTHGFLQVHSPAGDLLGRGELTQTVKKGDLVESRLHFVFKDGSTHEERVSFSQKRLFSFVRYRLTQRGASFPQQLDVTFDRGNADYEVRSRRWGDEKEELLRGKIDVPKDVYNGMLLTVLMNLPPRASESIKVLTFTPEPKIIGLALRFMDEHAVRIGEQPRKAFRYSLEPALGVIEKFFGKVLGKLPDDFHYYCWILADEIPAFVTFEGPLQLLGPIVRIELVSPRLEPTSE